MANYRSLEPKDWKTEKILWRNAQWAVTAYGIENVRGPCHYHIEKAALHMGSSIGWCDHMAAKNWVISELFDECFAQALRIHVRTEGETIQCSRRSPKSPTASAMRCASCAPRDGR